jgi:hypothetical protein
MNIGADAHQQQNVQENPEIPVNKTFSAQEM